MLNAWHATVITKIPASYVHGASIVRDATAAHGCFCARRNADAKH
jgi:hypothetical protein